MPRPPKRRPKEPNGAGSVYYDKARRNWRVMVVSPDGRRRTVRAATEDEARKRRTELLGNGADGIPVGPADSASLSNQLGWWRDYVLPSRNLAPATVDNYRWALGIVETGLGRARLKTLTPEQVEAFLQRLADEGYSRNAVRLVRTTLSQVLKEAEKRGHVPRNVAALTVLPATATPPAERDALTADEAGRLLAAAKGDRLAAYWTLALTTGARRGELLGLSWDDVDLDAATMTIRHGLRRAKTGGYEVGPTKNKASVRTVRLAPVAVAALKDHQADQRKEHIAADRWTDTGLVFTTTVGTHVDPNTIRHRWTSLCKATGLEGRVPHELRHTAASVAVDEDVNMTKVADGLGHANNNMLDRTYRHKTQPVADGLADVMEDFVTPRRRHGRTQRGSVAGGTRRRGPNRASVGVRGDTGDCGRLSR